MTTLWCEWVWMGGDTPVADVRIVIDGDSIVSVTTGVVPTSADFRLAGLTMPGFANAHSHAFHRMLRGRTQGGGGTFWTWREAMYEAASTLDPEGYRQLATSVFREMLASGFTCVGEFHYLHHAPVGVRYREPNAMSDAVAAAADETGIRMTLLDTLYLHGGLDQGEHTELAPVQQRFSDGSVETWMSRMEAFRPPSDLVRPGAAIHSVRAVDPRSIEEAAAWAKRTNVPLHAHVSEQPAENEACLAAHGVSPIRLLGDLGALDTNFTAVHAVHIDDDDRSMLATGGSTVAACPTTERDLADGIVRADLLRTAGVPVAIGSDSQAVIDPFEEMSALELHLRLATGIRGVIPIQALLDAGTQVGYRSLGWERGGTIAPGSLADLVTVTTSESDPDHMLAAALYADRVVTDVFVGGVRRGGGVE